MKKHIYFKEDTQELLELPITVDNCYYIGEFNNNEIELIKKFLDKNVLSFVELRLVILHENYK